MQPENLQDLYVASLRKTLAGERELVEALPFLIEAVENEGLQQAFQDHRNETTHQVERLRDLLDGLNENEDKTEAPGIAALIAECEHMIDSGAPVEVKEAALVAIAQQIEHVEIASYGALVTYAEMLGRGEDYDQLQTTLTEEQGADRKLNELAKEIINAQARSG